MEGLLLVARPPGCWVSVVMAVGGPGTVAMVSPEVVAVAPAVVTARELPESMKGEVELGGLTLVNGAVLPMFGSPAAGLRTTSEV